MVTVIGFEPVTCDLLSDLLITLHLRDMADVAHGLERHLLADLRTHFERPAVPGGGWRLTPNSDVLVRELRAIAHDTTRPGGDCRVAIRQAVLMSACTGTPS